ncbi:MAG: ATP-binding cassette domain-containing protein [Acidimicrobiia bacterium]|nr:ATP-binding cassette domain-containing protein [Acidimicrobiia bacterium]
MTRTSDETSDETSDRSAEVMANAPIISVENVSRWFGEVAALDGVTLDVRTGEVLAVLGENGAGKTTLMRILGGLDAPNGGRVLLRGEPYEPRSPKDAVHAGIALVHQHFALVPTMTAAENILLFRSDPERRCSRAEAARQLAAEAAELGFTVDPNAIVGELSVGEQQRLELLRALDASPDVLLLDEPTAVLTDDEATALLNVVRRLAVEQNKAVILITHRLREVTAAADRVVVLRTGKVVSPEAAVGDRSPADLAAEMVGSEVASIHRDDPTPGDVVLDVRNLSAGKVRDASLEVRRGELVGVAGVDGNGQVELELAICGLLEAEEGTITLEGDSLIGVHPRRRIRMGVAYLPSDRYARALVGPMSCEENLRLGRTQWRLTPDPDGATSMLSQWTVKGDRSHSAGSLSGGNAQKLVAAREFGQDTKLLVACQPTRGLDPGAAGMVRQASIDFARDGGAVLFVSADLDEILETADRLYVASDGHFHGPFNRPFDRARIGRIMAGVDEPPPEGASATVGAVPAAEPPAGSGST